MSHNRPGQGNTYNLHYGNTYNFYFGQTSPQTNTAVSGILNNHPDPLSYACTSMSRDDDRSIRWPISRDDDRSERWPMSRDDDISEGWSMSRDDDRSERWPMSRDDDRSERWPMSRDDDRSERSNSTRARRESAVATSQNDDSKCKVCLDNSADCVIYTCGHVVCDSCGQRLRSESLPCHICRQPIQDIVKIYR